MRASDILQGLAGLLAVLDRQEQTAVQAPQPIVVNVNTTAPETTAQPTPQPQASHALAPVAVDNKDTADQGTFVPPLQAKLELLKKSVGVDSVYDQGGPDEQLTGHGADNEQDELARMKQMAGIHIAGEDNDITG
jgi:hypothetical protein